MWKSVGLVLLCFVPEPSAGDADAAARDQKEMQGSWRPVSFEINGEKATADIIQGIRVSIKGDVFNLTAGSHELTARFKLHADATPKGMEMTPSDGPFKDVVNKGIYRFDKGKLTICMYNSPHKDDQRPRAFATQKDGRTALIVLERSKN